MSRFQAKLHNLLALAAAFVICLAAIFPSAAAAIDSSAFQQLLTPFYDATTPTCATGGGTNGSIDLLMQAIAIHESSDNPTAGSAAHASGKYQFEPATWQGLTKQLYPPAGKQYAVAMDAPEVVQDAVAYLAFAHYALSNYNAFQIAVAWYGGAGILNNLAANFNVVPPGNRLTYGQYGNEIVGWMQAGNASDAVSKANNDNSYGNRPLSSVSINPEAAPDFSTYLAKLGGTPPSIKVVAYDSSGQPTGNATTVTGTTGSTCSSTPAGSFVFYNQGDSRWSGHPIYTANSGGTDTIGPDGCGPTSAAMVIASLANSSITPIDTGDYMTNLGSGDGYTSGGATVSGLEQAVEHWGLSATSIGAADYATARQVLQNGGLIIAGGMGLSPFSKEGHVVVIRGLDANGNFLIGNPAPTLQSSQDEGFSAQALQAAGLSYMIEVTK